MTNSFITLRAALFSPGLVILLSLLVQGCINLGPQAIETERSNYNTVLRDTADQQLLLNLVRMRYLERPYFLEVSSVTSQFTFSSSGLAGLSIDDYADGTGVELQGTYEEAPTVAYQPLQGEDFVRRLLAPLPIEALVLLTQSGWSIERIMRVCVQRTNDIGNAVTASGPTPLSAPDFERFQSVAHVARVLQQRDQLSLTIDSQPTPHLKLVIHNNGEQTVEYQQLVKLLGLNPNATSFELRDALQRPADKNVITVQTRSLNGILYYLSHGVDIPEPHLKASLVRQTLDRRGGPFNWSALTHNLIDIQSGKERPEHAVIAVFHRDHWYWIADNDLESKSTFMLLSQLLALQAGGAEAVRPVLTLPVGG